MVGPAGRGTGTLLSMLYCTAEPILSRSGVCFGRTVCPGLSLPGLPPSRHTYHQFSFSLPSLVLTGP